MSGGKLKIAFLVGKDDAATRNVIDKISASPNVEIVAVLIDTARDLPARRWRNLRRNIRREGLSYIGHRLVSAIRVRLERWADRVISPNEVEELLERAFPNRSLANLARQHGFQVVEAGNLNEAKAIKLLTGLTPDLGVVLGTRILKRATFSVPRQGSINLHKGKVPEYRGMPPGFWELYDGCDSASVTVHQVDDGLDTGGVLGTSEIPIHPKETPESLRRKLDQAGIEAMTEVVGRIALRTAVPEPQSKTGIKARTRPTRAQTLELTRKLPHWRRFSDGREAVKIAVWLAIFHTGIFSGLRFLRRKKGRGAILLYHRVNDISQDVLTTSTGRFAEHLVTLRQYYKVTSTEEIVRRVASGVPLEFGTVALHFDDCYRDVRTCAAPLLAAAGAPAAAFVSSGFVDTTRAFRHDEEKYPHRFENFLRQDLCDLPRFGITVAAHTVNHVDLGAVCLDEALLEVTESRRELERMTEEPVLLFSFPFGRTDNIRPEVRGMVVSAGYDALFSAHGGFIGSGTSLFDIPRIGVSSDHSALALMMELEGFSLNQLKQWLRSRLLRS